MNDPIHNMSLTLIDPRNARNIGALFPRFFASKVEDDKMVDESVGPFEVLNTSKELHSQVAKGYHISKTVIISELDGKDRFSNTRSDVLKDKDRKSK
ncbi:hypothetical protein V6N13_126682 [Hibiscus sabdariffa]